MFTPSLLAVEGASRILDEGLQTSTKVAEAWNRHWLTAFDSPLFTTIVYYSGLFAAGALVLFMLQFIKRMVDEEDYAAALKSLVLAFILCGLLANNGFVLAGSVRTLRGVVHNLSNRVLEVTLLDTRIRDAITASATQGAIISEIRAQLSQCYGMVGQKQITCLEEANKQVEQTIGAVQTELPIIANLLGPIRAVQRGIQGAIEVGGAQVQGGDVGSVVTAPGFAVAGFLGGFVGSAAQETVRIVLWGFQWGFTNLLEISMLLTGLISPFAVAGAFMFDGKSLWTWLTGFFAMGLAKVSYNIIVGLAAVVVVNAEATDTMGFLVIMAILAPALALALAAGGGMAIFHVINTGMARAIGTLSSFSPAIGGAKAVRGR